MLPRSDALRLLRTAEHAAHEGGLVLMKYFRKKFRIREKIGAGLVTEADLASEKRVIEHLRKNFPDFGFLAEESGIHLKSGSGRWIIDPLDGTTNFAHGFPTFSVSIAAEWNGQIVAGVVHHPVLKETFTAVLGGGARLNGQRIRVSTASTFRKALLTTGFSYRKDIALQQEIKSFRKLSEQTRAIRRPGSAALDLAYTAAGIFDGFWERRLSPWDMAAGYLLVTEAGGRVTDFSGKPFQLESRELLATNGKLHKSMVRLLKS